MAEYFARTGQQAEPLEATDIIRILADPQDTIAAALLVRDINTHAEITAALRLADTILEGMGPLYASGHGAKVIRAALAKAAVAL